MLKIERDMTTHRQLVHQGLYHTTNCKSFKDDDFWKTVPGWKAVTEKEFGDCRWQLNNSITSVKEIKAILQHRVDDMLLDDIQSALNRVPMNIRITPYIFALIDWDNPIDDPLRREYLPIASQLLIDHPFSLEDPLYEEIDSPVPYLTHRYPDKVLFLSLTICPHYCSYCTRSRMIGGSTPTRLKTISQPGINRYEVMFDYIRAHHRIKDVLVSGGDVSLLKPESIRLIGETLLNIRHIRRIRFATKSLAVFPMKVLTDEPWLRALTDLHRKGQANGQQVCIHTHFSSPREVTVWSQKAADRLYQEGIKVRNQSVFQAGVNDVAEVMELLIKQLHQLQIEPYYVFIPDMVPGIEHLRTTLREGVAMEQALRKRMAGYQLPTFSCDLPTGGGKKQITHYDYYNPETGVSVWRSPTVKPDKIFFYFDPVRNLKPEIRLRWNHADQRRSMLEDALSQLPFKLAPDPFYGLSNQSVVTADR
jgi:lysine 2,3-aminomutase